MHPFSTKNIIPNLPFAIMHSLAQMVLEQVPELKPDLPSFTHCNSKIGIDDSVCIAIIEFKESGIPEIGLIDANDFSHLKAIIGDCRRYAELSSLDGIVSFFDWNKLIIAVDVASEAIDWDLVTEDFVSWANSHPLPRAQKINKNRVLRAIPTPPIYSLTDVQSAMWVVECEESCIQGTAFDLANYGTIANAHVVGKMTAPYAFKANNTSTKFKAVINKINEALDLAIINIEGGQCSPLYAASTETKQMDHVAVCGFPNYRLGDSGVLSPGIIVGTRMRSGVRRLLTNAGIVAGMSGGPAIGANNHVIGVCVTGSDNFQETRETEDQSIIPIEALDLLK